MIARGCSQTAPIMKSFHLSNFRRACPLHFLGVMLALCFTAEMYSEGWPERASTKTVSSARNSEAESVPSFPQESSKSDEGLTQSVSRAAVRGKHSPQPWTALPTEQFSGLALASDTARMGRRAIVQARIFLSASPGRSPPLLNQIGF